MWWFAAALAYEVDAWTPRVVELDDTTALANIAMDEQLDAALARVRRRCDLDEDRVRRRVGRAVAKQTGRRVVVERPGLAALGHGAYSAWLETDPQVDRVTTGTDGIFADVGLLDSPVLRLAGTASTVRLGDTLVGTDKVDHFLATGFAYWRWSRWSERPERAVRRGVRTERLFFGRLTSKAFSYGDLSANWAGYRFYETLLSDGSVLQLDAEGCVQRVAGFDWGEWVSWEWDEFANPSVYGPRVSRALSSQLHEVRDDVCASYDPRQPDLPLPDARPHRLPEVAGPFGLESFCR